MKFIVDRTYVDTLEDGDTVIQIRDINNKDWYIELKKFDPSKLKVMYDQRDHRLLSFSMDASMLAPTLSTDAVTEIDPTEIDINDIMNLYVYKNKIVKLGKYMMIRNDEMLFDRDAKLSDVTKELAGLKIHYMERAFEFKPGLFQTNRSLDQNNLGNVTTLLLATGKTEFKNWKFKGEYGEDIYRSLTINEMLKMYELMGRQTTLSMMTESTILKELDNIENDDLKAFNAKQRFEVVYTQLSKRK